jgi:eukaryotic-like serine/threonine-protein kinase
MTARVGVCRAVHPIIMGHTAPPSASSTAKRHVAGVTVTPLAVGSYRPMLCLATGGMGSVYLGYCESAPADLVAIKRVHAHLPAALGLHDMLRAEARYMAAVCHPNVVRYVDFTSIDNEPALVMEYVEGSSLTQLGAVETAFPVSIALRIALDACAGLTAVHAASIGLVHRDVSPQNVMVGVDGIARIADFGVAKAADEEQAGLYGKRGYMAPEYLTTGVAAAPSDVFGLGVVIWELLAGRHLFRSSCELETIGRTLATQAPSLAKVSPVLAAALDPVLARALASDPEDRFTASELRVAIESAGLPIASREEVGEFVERAASAAVKRVAPVMDATPPAIEAMPLSLVFPSRRPPACAPSPLAVVRQRPAAVAPAAKVGGGFTKLKIAALAAFAVVIAAGTVSIARLAFEDAPAAHAAHVSSR